MRIVIVVLAALGCLLPYLASRRQQLIAHPLSKPAAWTAFAACEVLAAALLAVLYGPVTAVLMTFVLIMCIWPAFVFAGPHFRARPLAVSAGIVAVFALVLLAEAG